MCRPLGISSTMIGPDLTGEKLEQAVRRGITHIEVLLAAAAQDAQDANAAQLHNDLSAVGMTAWSVHAPFGGEVDLSAPDELQRRASVGEMRRACEVADTLEAKCVVVHAGLLAEDEAECALRRCQSLRSINCLLKRTSRLGLRLAIEYLPANKPRICNHSSMMLEVLNIVDGEAGVCLDTNHANLRESLAEAMLALADHIVTVHISDNDGEQERHMLPGEGGIDWPEFMRLLDEIGYDGPLMMEAGCQAELPERLDLTVKSAREYLGWEAPE